TVVPDPDVEAFCYDLIARGLNATTAQATLNAIANDPNPVTLTPLKSISAVTADSPGVTLPNRWTTLRVTSNDYANGASVYTWRKVYGAGNVSFTPNGTAAAKDAAVLFDGTPGHYLFEVKMSDSRGLTEVTNTVAVTLDQSGGTLPSNNPPVANNQSPTVQQAVATPVTLTASDPEGLAMNYSVTTGPAHGTLSGIAPYLIYTSDYSYNGPDSFAFMVTDSEGQTSSATVSITVSANNVLPTAIYEPFNYPAGSLNGVSGTSEVGFSGAWSTHVNTKAVATSLAYGSLPTIGGSMGNVSGNEYGGKRSISTSALASNGLLNDGSTLWFSYINGYSATANTTNSRLAFALANNGFSTSNYAYYILNDGVQPGVGLGVTLGRFDGVNGKNVATLFRDSSFGTSGFSGNLFGTVPNTIIGGGQQRLVVGKITWGAASDTIELYEPDPELNLGSVKSILTVNVDQSTFDTITFARGDQVTMDEIRFGPNYSSVLVGNAPMTADTTAPAPGTMAFYQAPAVTSTSSIGM
ncbi:MAG TPA: Ig-like domain-containing protein, partial [Candidatus Paceibacterota bacterium]|nr:Ig-like domain-containing protein [Candidatus Paceibacterota bacterium]